MEQTRTRIEPYSPEWFVARQGAFTASENWKLMTEPRSKKDLVSKQAETYILDKVWEKLTGQTKQSIDNYATQWGIEHEPLAKKWYGKLTGNTLYGSWMMFHESVSNFCATPDDTIEEAGLLEIKCPSNGANHLKHCFITTDDYFRENHPEYYWQCVSQMAVFQTEWCDFVSFDPRINSDLGFFMYRLKYNPEEVERLLVAINRANEMFNSYYGLFSKTS